MDLALLAGFAFGTWCDVLEVAVRVELARIREVLGDAVELHGVRT